MRIRNKPWAVDFLKENNHIVDVNGKYRGKIKEFFNNNHDIHVEVGAGRGKFITTLAKENPDINYVGIEVEKNVLVRALKKVLENNLTNVRLLLYDANHLEEYFKENEIDKIYLNFSDPWPKKRHEKRRLTYKTFLKQYQKILKNNHPLEFKTDNRELFEYSLISFNQFKTNFLEISLDLHNEENKNNIRTEYEDKFSKYGHKIYQIKLTF